MMKPTYISSLPINFQQHTNVPMNVLVASNQNGAKQTRHVNANIKSVPKVPKASKSFLKKITIKWWKPVALGAVLIVLLLIAIGIVLYFLFVGGVTRIPVTFTTTTTTTTATTTTAPCSTGYVRHPSGTCVNLLIDFNNCGAINNVCPSNFLSCSNGVCSNAPAVQITGAVSVPGWGGLTSIDDAFVPLRLPFTISLYGNRTYNASVTTNGVVCIGACSSAFSNTALPSGSFNGPTAFGFWDDLFIYSGTSQSVYYGTTGTFPNRELVFEFYTAHFSSRTRYYRFQIIFYEAVPDIVTYRYFQASDGGVSATVGVQRSATGPVIQFSHNQANIPIGAANTTTPTLILRFDTIAGSFTQTAG